MNRADPDPVRTIARGDRLAAGFLVLAGLGVLSIWGISLVQGAFADGLWHYQDGNYPLFHLAAEGLMGVAALIAGAALWRGTAAGCGLGLLACGMLGYSAVNNAGWPLRNDPTLLVPMGATLVGALLTAVYLLRGKDMPGRASAAPRRAAAGRATMDHAPAGEPVR